MKKSILFLFVFSFFLFTSKAQMQISPATNMTQLVNNFILTGVSASNIVYTGDSNAIGSFTGGNSTNLGMSTGIILTTGVVNGTLSIININSAATNFSSYNNFMPGDSLLNTLIPGYISYDASILEFDLVPVGNILEFQYVFGSEEYPEYVGSSFNDVFGFFLSGLNPGGGSSLNENIALIPGSNVPVCINNVNTASNSTYYINNGMGTTIVFDGFTTVLLAQASVVPGTAYHLKMAIADVSDGVFDSGIFLKAQSMKSYTLVGVEENATRNFSIAPNPMGADSKLSLNLSHPGKVKINITDISGKVVYAVEKSFGSAGPQQISLNDFKDDLSSGIYLLRVDTDDFTEMQKIVK